MLLFGAYAVALVVVVSLFEGGLPLHFGGGAPASLCGTTVRSGDYRWPVKPFVVQHAIRGSFGDPRTLSDVAFGDDRVGSAGDYSFHNGVDISARAGTKVYPVVSGWATVVDGDEVRVLAGHRVFQYHHIAPAFRQARHVVAGVTVLGAVSGRRTMSISPSSTAAGWSTRSCTSARTSTARRPRCARST